MKHHWILLLTAMLVAACQAPDESPSLLSFKIHKPSTKSPSVDMTRLDQPVWVRGKSGEMVATGHVTITNSQDAARSTAWVKGNADRMELCYQIPYAELDPNSAHAAAAWIVPIEFHVAGLSGAPKQSTIRSDCDER